MGYGNKNEREGVPCGANAIYNFGPQNLSLIFGLIYIHY